MSSAGVGQGGWGVQLQHKAHAESPQHHGGEQLQAKTIACDHCCVTDVIDSSFGHICKSLSNTKKPQVSLVHKCPFLLQQMSLRQHRLHEASAESTAYKSRKYRMFVSVSSRCYIAAEWWRLDVSDMDQNISRCP